jgi:hypothetical protein
MIAFVDESVRVRSGRLLYVVAAAAVLQADLDRARDEFRKLLLPRQAYLHQPPTSPEDNRLGEQIAAVEARLEEVAIQFADDPYVSADQVRAMTRRLRATLDELQTRHAERMRSNVLAGMAGADLAATWVSLSLSRRRAIISVLTESVIVLPTTRRGRGFDPSRIDIRWR